MPRLRTDDAARRLRAVWLGPPGRRVPGDLPYVVWATFAGFALPLIALWALIGWVLFGSTAAILFGPTLGVGCAVGLTRLVNRVVEYDRPVRYWRADIRAVLSAPKAGPGIPFRVPLRARMRRVVMTRAPRALLPPAPADLAPED